MHLRIAEYRKERGMTLGDLAKKIEVSIPTMWRMESNADYPITPNCLALIAHTLGVSVKDLITEDGPAPTPTAPQEVAS